jgi:hypothetical protein
MQKAIDRQIQTVATNTQSRLRWPISDLRRKRLRRRPGAIVSTSELMDTVHPQLATDHTSFTQNAPDPEDGTRRRDTKPPSAPISFTAEATRGRGVSAVAYSIPANAEMPREYLSRRAES